MKKAFTLFELLVVISIVGILIAVASISYSGAQKKSRDARRIQDMNAIQKAAEMYYSQNNYVYPGTSQLTASGLMSVMPIDPKNSTPYVYNFSGLVNGANNYCLCVRLESTTGGNASDSNCTMASSGAYYCVRNQQ